MGRYLLLFAVLVLALLALRRSLGRSSGGGGGGGGSRGGGSSSRPPRRKLEGRDAPQTLVCADCGTRYDPQVSGWVCPRCGK